MASDPPPACCFCGGDQLVLTHRELFHPMKKDHGPFVLYRCRSCGSGLTLPPPSADSLTRLYQSFRSGLPDLHREITRDDPQTALYRWCVRRIDRLAGLRRDDRFTWMDVGAGGGEFSREMAEAFPNSSGIAVDLHSRPALLNALPRVRWLQCNLNESGFAERLGIQADAVMAISVWEHVLKPDQFVGSLIQLVRNPGWLYLLCPNYGSWARRLMGAYWPYFTPGEHLYMPTPEGARTCLKRQWIAAGHAAPQARISAKPVMLPYTLRYVLRRFGVNLAGRMIPPALHVPLPAGALEAALSTGQAVRSS